MRRPAWGALAALVVCGLAACGIQTVTVAQIGPSIDGGASAQCMTSADCVSVAYCAKLSCEDEYGTCLEAPVMCPGTWSPVCGCDGVNFWNDCLRQRDGVSASTPGDCTSDFVTCNDDASACPPDGFCDRLDRIGHPGDGEDCNLLPIGICRVLPDECATDAGGPSWQSCAPNGSGSSGGGEPPSCTNTCTAISLGLPYRRVMACH